MRLSIEEIQKEVDEMVSKIGYPPHSVTVFSVTTNDGTPYVSFENEMYNYVSSERGYEFSRKTTKSIDELLYWITSDFVSNISFQYELEHRILGRDGRRMAFPMIIAFMARMNKEWEIKAQKEIDQTLSNAPYDDSLYL
ncbi:Imm63 family immunity protein [Pantoea septica]|uniref:Imm63 family immunity protein n=1 Tax=Pantoea septica TaxID=472695 RepID=UPI00289D134E|nr:Imm63 family immunity protein [Pantoea septica]